MLAVELRGLRDLVSSWRDDDSKALRLLADTVGKDLQNRSEELVRRLDELNHAHAANLQRNAEFVRAPVYEGKSKEIEQRLDAAKVDIEARVNAARVDSDTKINAVREIIDNRLNEYDKTRRAEKSDTDSKISQLFKIAYIGIGILLAVQALQAYLVFSK